ncbi:MAG: autotransporter outer membrane beta-barrel domain-containing protein, partial [Armatimonadetes bacterium]|nr:autotransporter outer membrane beta-barrel domain-containing protein [Akkermansiaceae bacterium]
NNGSITATTSDGIEIGDNGTIVNTGSVIGGDDGIESFSGTTFALTNTGFITGVNNAFNGDTGDDTLNLNLGSRIVGNVLGNGGTDTINFDGGLSSTASASGVSSNSILGDVEVTDINKTGTGTAFIGVPGYGGFNVLADTIDITGGGLYINGDIDGLTAVQSTINSGGAALGGTGTWDANIFVTAGGFSAGAIPINLDVNPANGVGEVIITGDVDHSAGSFIRFDVRPNSIISNGINSDRIVQNGAGNTYDVAGTSLRISSTNNNQVIRNGTYTVVDSDEAITGFGTFGNVTVQFNPNVNGSDSNFFGSEVNFAAAAPYNNANTVLSNFFTDVALADGGTNIVLTVDHDFESLAFSENTAELGAALDASINSPNALTQDFIAALDNSSLLFVQDTLASLVPDNLLNQASALVSSNYRIHRLAQDHLAMTRSSGVTITETPASTDAKGGTIPAQTTSSGGGNANVWGTFSYDWKDSEFGDADFEGEDASFTAGFDYRVAPDWLVGILIDGSQGDYDYNGGSSDVDSLRAAIYGTYGQATGFYADFLVGYGDHELDSDRDFGGILFGSSNSSTDANSLQAMLTVGYTMESGTMKHGPFAGVEYQNIDVDGYTQTGAFPIGVEDFDVDSVRGLIGYRAEASYGQLTPYASVAYAHEFEDGAIETTAFIPGGAGFRTSGGGIESAILISLGTGYSFNSNLGMNIGYHGEISVGGDGVDSHGGSIGLNYAF